jgi:hypothetical protein
MDYSQLQKLQEELDQKEKARKTAKPQAVKIASPQEVLPANPQTHMPEKPLVGKPAKPLDRKPVIEQVEKYTTRLIPSMVKRIKIYAAQQDMHDYDVVAKALIEYFERNM